MAEQAAKEPTMEEILSSIRRIISDGGDEAASAEPDTGDIDAEVASESNFDVSDLVADNEQSEDDGEHLMSVEDLLNSDDTDFSDSEDLSVDLDIEEFSPETEIEDVASELDIDLEIDLEHNDTPVHDTPVHDMAETPPQEVTMPQPAQQTQAQAVPVAAAALTGGAGTALEGLVSELMKPIIQEWIETNLPNIVERRVEAEINQIAAKVISALRD